MTLNKRIVYLFGFSLYALFNDIFATKPSSAKTELPLPVITEEDSESLNPSRMSNKSSLSTNSTDSNNSGTNKNVLKTAGITAAVTGGGLHLLSKESITINETNNLKNKTIDDFLETINGELSNIKTRSFIFDKDPKKELMTSKSAKLRITELDNTIKKINSKIIHFPQHEMINNNILQKKILPKLSTIMYNIIKHSDAFKIGNNKLSNDNILKTQNIFKFICNYKKSFTFEEMKEIYYICDNLIRKMKFSYMDYNNFFNHIYNSNVVNDIILYLLGKNDPKIDNSITNENIGELAKQYLNSSLSEDKSYKYYTSDFNSEKDKLYNYMHIVMIYNTYSTDDNRIKELKIRDFVNDFTKIISITTIENEYENMKTHYMDSHSNHYIKNTTDNVEKYLEIFHIILNKNYRDETKKTINQHRESFKEMQEQYALPIK
jgi:hypothetical protein